MYKVAICDDDQEERALLTELVRDYFIRECLEHTIAVFPDGQSLLDDFHTGNRFDIYILDIIMPGLDGMTLAESIREQDDTGVIAFVTATVHYAVRGYGVKAMDYIVKPVTLESVTTGLSRIVEYLTQFGVIAIHITSKNKVKELPTAEIVFVESHVNAIAFNMSDGSVERVYARMDDYAEYLTRFAFFQRCHKSFIVNLNYVTELRNGKFYIRDGRTINISRQYMEDCKEKYRNRILSKVKR